MRHARFLDGVHLLAGEAVAGPGPAGTPGRPGRSCRCAGLEHAVVDAVVRVAGRVHGVTRIGILLAGM